MLLLGLRILMALICFWMMVISAGRTDISKDAKAVAGAIYVIGMVMCVVIK